MAAWEPSCKLLGFDFLTNGWIENAVKLCTCLSLHAMHEQHQQRLSKIHPLIWITHESLDLIWS